MVCMSMKWNNPRGSIYTTIMELGPQNHNGDGLLGPNSIIVVYMDPLGMFMLARLDVRCFEDSERKNPGSAQPEALNE